MTTHIRKGTCCVAEFNAKRLSQLLQETGAFVAMLEEREHGKYLVSHISKQTEECREIEWWEVTIFYDYFLDAWEELDLNSQTEKVDMEDELAGVPV